MLCRVLHSAVCQSRLPDEIIVAEDGAQAETAHVVHHFQRHTTIPIQHVSQEHKGFRVSAVRNKALAACTTRYVIFVDGDCLLPVYFVARHLQMAQPGYFVTGQRILLSRNYTQRLLDRGLFFEQPFCMHHFLRFLCGSINTLIPFIYIPLPRFLRLLRRTKWQGARCCNFAAWYHDCCAVNGFDERYEGWGQEDSDFTVRLIRSGVQRKDGRLACFVLHMWHPLNKTVHQPNMGKFSQLLREPSRVQAEVGLREHTARNPHTAWSCH